MSYEFYKWLHLFGGFLLISGLVGVYVTIWSGQGLPPKIKKFGFTLHGFGLVLILISGFGLLARLQLARDMPAWAYAKLGIWAFFAVLISIFKRKAQMGWPLYALMMIGYGAAAFIGIYKP